MTDTGSVRRRCLTPLRRRSCDIITELIEEPLFRCQLSNGACEVGSLLDCECIGKLLSQLLAVEAWLDISLLCERL